MKQIERSLTVLFLAGIALLILSSCMTFVIAPRTGQVEKTDIEDPSTHAIIFGAIGDPNQTRLGAKWPVASFNIGFIQLNPALPPEYLVSGNGMYSVNGVYYSRPVLAGGTYKLTHGLYVTTSGRAILYNYRYYGISGRMAWDLGNVQPGLNFFGSWSYEANEEGEKKPKISLQDPTKLRKRSKPSELECLQEILPTFKKTAWQAVIEARIAALSAKEPLK